jgi:hypothetical protein
VGDGDHGAAWARGMVRDAGATPRAPSLANRAVREGASPGVHRGRNVDKRTIPRLKLALGVAAAQP